MDLTDLTDLTVLVTGANGFVGARACLRLADRGADVRALVRRQGTAPDGARIVEVVGDFTDADDAATAVAGCSAVVHTAATAGPDWDEVRRVNTHGTATIADAAREAGVNRFVHVSTFSVYDRHPDLDEITEDTPTVDPDADDANPYAVTKLEAEEVVVERARDGLDAVIIRPPAVLGHGPTSTWGQKLPASVRDGDLLMNQPAHAHHAVVHVDDLVDACIAALAVDSVIPGRAYDVTVGTVVWADYLHDLHAMFDDAPPLPDCPDRQAWTGSVQQRRLADELDFRAERTYDEAMDEIRAAWRDDRPTSTAAH